MVAYYELEEDLIHKVIVCIHSLMVYRVLTYITASARLSVRSK